MTKQRAAITGIQGYVPDYILTNKELEAYVETNDEWIISRTGIKERRILKGEGKGSSDLGAEAVKGLLKKTNISAEEVDLIICATATPDMIFPSTACIIFGDGAGAVMLEPSKDGLGVQDAILRSDGSGIEFLHMKAGGSAKPASYETIDAGEHFIFQDGQPVFKAAVKFMADVSVEIMQKNNLTSDDVAWLVPHQANKRIIGATARRVGVEDEKVMSNIEKYGNTTNGTIPLCLWEWESKLNKGDNIILAAFGGGFTWGSIYLKWAYDSNK